MAAEPISRNRTMVVQSGSLFSAFISNIDHLAVDKAKATNKVIYGFTALKYGKKGRPHKRRFYIYENDMHYLQWISPQKEYINSRINLTQIRAITQGNDAERFKKHTNPTEAQLCVSITHVQHSALCLVFQNAQELQIVMSGIQYLMEDLKGQAQKDELRDELRVRNEWTNADTDGNGNLDSKEIQKLLHKLNYDLDKTSFRNLFKKFDADNSGVLDFNEFTGLMEEINQKKELDPIFEEFSIVNPSSDANINNQRVITLPNFTKFIHDKQGVTQVDPDYCWSIFNLFGPGSKAVKVGKDYQYLNQSGFRQFIFSFKDNSVINPNFAKIFQDMTCPLPSYYINSSHNTYLEGHQLYGNSSCEMYRRVLFDGCRCVELDCWDGPGGWPKVTHGKTLCKDIKFSDVIETINENAFVTSPYPVILSLEMHCGIEQQDKISSIMTAVFGDQIYTPPADMRTYPSPEQLKGKIIIKGKKPESGTNKIEVEYQECENEPEQNPTPTAKDKKANSSKKKVHKVKVSENLIPLIGMDGCKFSMTSERKPTAISSVTSTKLKKLEKKEQALNLINYHKFHFTRVYPHGLKIDSSNYNPMNAWTLGAQVVALNMQTPDLGMLLNRAWFAMNGGINNGYVLKPEFMYDLNDQFDPNAECMNDPIMSLEVEVISAQQIPKPNGSTKGEIIDPFVELGLHGIEKDNVKPIATPTIDNNGFNPIWKFKTTFNIRMPELAVLTLQIFDKDALKKTLIAQQAIHVTMIRSGIRVVPLIDTHFESLQ